MKFFYNGNLLGNDFRWRYNKNTKNQEDKLEEAKRELVIMLPEVCYDDYFKEQVKNEIEKM